MSERTVKTIGWVMLLLFAVIGARLGWLMLAQSDVLADQARQQQTRRLDYYQYARGDIVDQAGRALTNVTENCAVVFPAMVADNQAVSPALAAILDTTQETMAARLALGGESAVSPYILKTGLSAEQAQALADQPIPGVMCLPLAARYGSPAIAPHLLGTVRQAADGWQGVSGLELRYDSYLRQRAGRKILAYVDANGGLSAETLYVQEPEYPNYHELRLTLDLDYQQIAQQAFERAGLSGACVIMEPDTGDLLAAVSAPAFDPYGWEAGAGDVYVNKVFALYPPASTFKTVLAAAALSEQVKLPQSPLSGETAAVQAGEEEPEAAPLEEAGEATAEALAPEAGEELPAEAEGDEAADEADEAIAYGPFICAGEYQVNEAHSVHCLGSPEGHGEVDLNKAFALSCNCYFVALGQSLGGDLIKDYAERLGLTGQQLLGYDLGLETPADHLDFNSQVEAEVANASLGELGVRISPLQEARLMAALCNGGFLVEPRLVQGVYDHQGQAILTYARQDAEQVLDDRVAAEMKGLLQEAVATGTGQAAQSAYFSCGGKTGTSEAGGVWFSGFAPAEQPRWVISVYVEQGTAGGVEAAALFKDILDHIAVLEGEAGR